MTGCKRHDQVVHNPNAEAPLSVTASPGTYTQTNFQDEAQFIVETVVTDLAEQIYYATFHKLPEPGTFSVSAKESSDSQTYAPTYEVQVDMDGSHLNLKTNLNVSGPIWSPETYAPVADLLAKSVGLATGTTDDPEETELLAKLTDGRAKTIEVENQNVSSALENDFTSPRLHEQAAVVLGAFMLREHSGDFFEIRLPLCRMTAHLAMARLLKGDELASSNGRMAGAMLLTLMNNQADALVKLQEIKTNNAALVSWVRALSARNTADYRPLDKLDGLSQLECIEWFYALDRAANTDVAWSKLSDVQKKLVSYVRIASQQGYSVEEGHELYAVSLALEFEEIGSVYELSRSKKITKDDLVAALNEMPDRCIYDGAGHKAGVHVIGWGLWAGFLQRQLCHAVRHDFDFLQRKWGVPDDAKTFSDQVDETLGGLRLYPFVRRFDSIDFASYRKSVGDSFKVTVATPQLVPIECWNYLGYKFSDLENYQPNPDPRMKEWLRHGSPPGTAYNVDSRLNEGSVTYITALVKSHERAPYDGKVISSLILFQCGGVLTDTQVSQYYGVATEYDIHAMNRLANSSNIQPGRYEYLMNKAAELDPSDYFTLAKYYVEGKQDDKAAAAFAKGEKTDLDSIKVASYAAWRINYYMKKGQMEEARRIADYAGEVYSYDGLHAKAEFLEVIKDYAGAFQWYSNINERYNDAKPLVSFCVRYKSVTGDTRYDSEAKKWVNQLFPKGIENVTLASFAAPPAYGVVFQAESDLMRAAGLKAGDVIVALNGVRVYGIEQFEYQRDSNKNPELDLIVWQGDGYHEIKASPPGRRFGVPIASFRKK